MIEILTSPEFERVLDAFGLTGIKTYTYHPDDPIVWADGFEVWQIQKDSLQVLSSLSEGEWIDRFEDRWWRYCDGTNLEGGQTRRFEIGGCWLVCWNNPDISDYAVDEEEDGQLVFCDRDLCYDNILQYCAEEWGATTPKNVCAICAGLAKLNEMTMGELFHAYLRNEDSIE